MASNSEAILDRAAEIIEKASPQLVLVLTVLSDVIKDIGPKDLGEMAGMIVYEVM
ncbi:hypothetical protein [Roseimaritima sediminicola]|uniref:hypothetical protein n=1 Tax=Roseimaritima sediminicola TaxID=2662066 RepID=UPI0012983446|nr:hypothetical protein [Roseimaritima sediminicola]